MSRFNDWRKRVHRKVRGQVERTAKQFGNFKQRQFGQVRDQLRRQWDGFSDFKRRQIVQHRYVAKKSFIQLMKASPYITAVLAAICAFIPVVGWIIALALVALGALIGRYGGYYAKRYQGGTTQESRNYGRTMLRRNWQSGSIGAAVGGIAAAIVSIVTAAPAAASAAGDVSLMAGEGGADLVGSGAEVAYDISAPAGGWLDGAVQGAYSAAPGLTPVPVGTQLGAAAPGFFSNAWSWVSGNYDKILSTGTMLYGGATKLLSQQQQAPAFNFNMAGGQGGAGGDPGGPGPGSGGGGVDWGEAAEKAIGFFDEYGVFVAIGLGVAILLVFFLG